jgi:hypothetical protein
MKWGRKRKAREQVETEERIATSIAATTKPLMVMVAELKAELKVTETKLRIACLRVSRLRAAGLKCNIDKDELARLRKRAAYYLHPDRGGDLAVMQALNTLFDNLQTA